MQDETYEAMLEAAKSDKASIEQAAKLNPFVWLICGLLVVVVAVAIWAMLEHAAAQHDYAATQADLRQERVNFDRLKNSEKALVRAGFWFDSDGHSQYIALTKSGIKMYKDTCEGYPCIRFYTDSSR